MRTMTAMYIESTKRKEKKRSYGAEHVYEQDADKLRVAC